MSQYTIILGTLLILLGLLAYFGTGRASITALIPAFLGLPILLAGFIGRNPELRKYALHGAAILAFIGFVGTLQGFVEAIALVFGREVDRPGAVVVQALTAVFCGIYLVMAVLSFVRARREPTAE